VSQLRIKSRNITNCVAVRMGALWLVGFWLARLEIACSWSRHW